MSSMNGTGQWRARLEDVEDAAQRYPALAALLKRPESRRQVMRLMAAGMALGGLAGCDPAQPEAHYVPAVKPPPNIIPGRTNHYATANIACGDVAGIVVSHRMGRPIKIEGNPEHPASLGATDIHGQAAILDFYDPDRDGGVLQGGQPSSFQALLTALLPVRARLAEAGGRGFHILGGKVASPTLASMRDGLQRRYPGAVWHEWEPVSRARAQAGLRLAYGADLDLLPHPDRADVILALDSDLISTAPGHLRHARGFASRRNPVRAKMSRVYAAEATPGLIGAVADHRVAAGPAEMLDAIRALGAAILGGGLPADAPRWLAPAIADLQRAGAHGLVHGGPDLPPEAQAVIHAVNEKLGARGTTFDLIPAVTAPEADIAPLIAAMQAGQVETLLILDGNPAYTAPGFAEALPRVRFSLHTAPAPDETAPLVSWHVPGTHAFEAWGDARAFDGTATIMQPQALPLFGGVSPLSLLGLFTDPEMHSSETLVRDHWRGALDDAGWRDALARGVVPGTASQVVQTPLRGGRLPDLPPTQSGLQVLVRPDPNLWDGRHANNSWLQELPRPLSKLVWDNPVLIAPALARREGLVNGAEVALSLAGQTIQAPVWIMPGQAEDCVVAMLGGGRHAAGAVGNGVGVDVSALRGLTGTPSLRATGRRIPVASTDHHNVLEVDRQAVDEVVHHGTLAEFTSDPRFLHKSGTDEPVIYDRKPDGAVAWGMSVDLNSCIGCNACVIACQAENNVPVVGKDQVMLGREMHWLRIDRYYEGPAEDPDSFFQPMLCMQCEEAPCEPVCPVEASVHDSEGLNLQVYNRCIGTRFCSNNCPYKVRRFNFGAWAAEEHRPPISRNPEVTVRARGVMEKCTFCVQRIAEARLAHDRDGTPEQTVTACQAACPTQVFTFGNINDEQAAVVKRKASPLDYALLADQNTRPRLTFEAVIRNPPETHINTATGAAG